MNKNLTAILDKYPMFDHADFIDGILEIPLDLYSELYKHYAPDFPGVSNFMAEPFIALSLYDDLTDCSRAGY